MEREAAAAAVASLRGEDANYHDGTFTSWAKERSASHPYPAGAGEAIGVADRDLTPWDEFTTKLDASPIPPSTSEGEDSDDPDDDGDRQDGPGVGLVLPPDHRGDDQSADREQDGERVAEDQ